MATRRGQSQDTGKAKQRGTRGRSPKSARVGSGRGSSSPGAPQRQSGRVATSAPLGLTLPLLRTSERSTFKKCEFLWDLTYNRNLKPLTDAPALRFGSLCHKALAGWYIPGIKRGVHPAKGFAAAYDADVKANEETFGFRAGDDEKWTNARELGIAMMNNYVEEYGNDPDWEVIATEMPFEVMVYREVRIDEWPHSRVEPWFYYVGIIDGCWRHRRTKEIWIPDHKSTAGIGDSKLKYLQVDDQAGMYWSYGVQYLREHGILKPKQELTGMMYNFLRKAMPDERPSKIIDGHRRYLNKDGSISLKQPSPYFLRQPIFRDEFDREEAKRRASVDMTRIQLVRDGELELSKNPGMFTCPTCAMRDACELHETGHDWEGFLKQTSKPWDPYAEHEIYDGR